MDSCDFFFFNFCERIMLSGAIAGSKRHSRTDMARPYKTQRASIWSEYCSNKAFVTRLSLKHPHRSTSFQVSLQNCGTESNFKTPQSIKVPSLCLCLSLPCSVILKEAKTTEQGGGGGGRGG